MRKFLLALGLLLSSSTAYAQNTTCATRPVGDNSNACATTAFVHSAVSINPVDPAAFGAIPSDPTKSAINAAAFVAALSTGRPISCFTTATYYTRSILVPATAASLSNCNLEASGAYTTLTAVLAIDSNTNSFVADNNSIVIDTATFTDVINIIVANSNNATIVNNRLSGGYYNVLWGHANNTRILNNVITSYLEKAITSSGDTTGFQVTGNIISGAGVTSSHAIYLDTNIGSITFGTISLNKVSNSRFWSISCQNCDDVIISNNLSFGSLAESITVSGNRNKITNNDVTFDVATSLDVGMSFTLFDSTVCGNSINGPHAGGMIINATSTNNLICDNSFISPTVAPSNFTWSGIFEDNTNPVKNIYSGNKFKNVNSTMLWNFFQITAGGSSSIFGLNYGDIGTTGYAAIPTGSGTPDPGVANPIGGVFQDYSINIPTYKVTLASGSGAWYDGIVPQRAFLGMDTGTNTTFRLYSNILFANVITADISGGGTSFYNTITAGTSGTRLGSLVLNGNTSGSATVRPQAVAGTPILTLPNTTGTIAVGASSPIVLNTTTGNITCPTCATSSGGGSITGTSPISVSAGGVVSLDAAGVTYAKIQNLGALALMGRSANSSGVGADIQATAASDAVLRESGSTIGFGTIASGGIANNAVTLAKLATQTTNTVLGNATSGTAVPTALAVGTCSTSSSALIWTTNTGFGCNTSVVASSATNSAITDDTTTNATMNLAWVTSNTGNLPLKVTSTKLNFNPLTGNLAATLFNGNALTAGSYTLTGAAAKTLTFSNTLTLAGTDSTTMTFPTTTATIARTDAGQTFTGTNAFGVLTATGGSHTGITSLGIRDTSAAFDVTVAATSSSALSAGRTLTLNMGNVAHTLALGTTANTITFPNAASDTVGMLGVAQTWTGVNQYNANTDYELAVGTGAGFWLASKVATVATTQRFFFGTDATANDTFRIFSALAGSNILQYAANATATLGIMTIQGTLAATGLTNTATTSAVCYNTGTGTLTYDGTIGTCTVSDERLKKIEGRIPNALEKLLKIDGVYYTWRDPKKMGSGHQIGVGAQTVERVFPELVQADSSGYKSADYQRLVAPIIEALRELKADNDNIRTEIKQMKLRTK